MTEYPAKKGRQLSFDGGTKISSQSIMPDRLRFWNSHTKFNPRLIPQGSGLSYAAASFGSNTTSISHLNFNRILNFDPIQNIIEVEAGLTLFDLFIFLESKNLYLPVQPGFSALTIGGCVAANVHGKNQHRDGTFINQIESIALFHPSHGIIHLSKKENFELFNLTCGGYGLTGNILNVSLRAVPIPSNTILLDHSEFTFSDPHFEECFSNQNSDFSYSWHDLSRPKDNFGDGIIFKASFIDSNSYQALPNKKQFQNHSFKNHLPFSIWNKFSVKTANWLYYTAHKLKTSPTELSLFESLFPLEKKLFYFKFFGKNGFHEYQAIIPTRNIKEFFASIKFFLKHTYIPVTLGSCKFFSGSDYFLRFTGDGICIALNFPRSNKSLSFCQHLDSEIIRLDGKPNIIKDSRLPKFIIEKTYPEVDMFRAALRDFDPKRIYRSELSERLKL